MCWRMGKTALKQKKKKMRSELRTRRAKTRCDQNKVKSSCVRIAFFCKIWTILWLRYVLCDFCRFFAKICVKFAIFLIVSFLRFLLWFVLISRSQKRKFHVSTRSNAKTQSDNIAQKNLGFPSVFCFPQPRSNLEGPKKKAQTRNERSTASPEHPIRPGTGKRTTPKWNQTKKFWTKMGDRGKTSEQQKKNK